MSPEEAKDKVRRRNQQIRTLEARNAAFEAEVARLREELRIANLFSTRISDEREMEIANNDRLREKVRKLEKALADERERCAKVANSHKAKHEDWIQCGPDGDERGVTFYCDEGEAIAKKIREGGGR